MQKIDLILDWTLRPAWDFVKKIIGVYMLNSWLYRRKQKQIREILVAYESATGRSYPGVELIQLKDGDNQ